MILGFSLRITACNTTKVSIPKYRPTKNVTCQFSQIRSINLYSSFIRDKCFFKMLFWVRCYDIGEMFGYFSMPVIKQLMFLLKSYICHVQLDAVLFQWSETGNNVGIQESYKASAERLKIYANNSPCIVDKPLLSYSILTPVKFTKNMPRQVMSHLFPCSTKKLLFLEILGTVCLFGWVNP